MTTSATTTTDDPRDLARLAAAAATAAADLVRRDRPASVDVAGTKSSSVDVVTAMDVAAEELLRRTLLASRPDDGILGEEGGLHRGTSGITWVVDPIDGTVNYVYGIPAYSVSVAAVSGDPTPEAWTLEAGCVVAVADGRTWWAARGHGAWSGERRLRVRDAVPLAQSLVATGFGYTEARRRQQARVVAEVLPRVRDIRRIGSAAIDLSMLADGGFDAYYERGLNPWDLAAGAVIAEEAGARVLGLRGARPGEAMTVAGPPGTAEALVELLETLDADTDAGADAGAGAQG